MSPDLSDEETALARCCETVSTAFRLSSFSRRLALQGADTFMSNT